MPNFLLTMWDTLNSSNIGVLVAAGLGMFAVIGGLAMLSYHYTLGSIKSRTVGDGQHGTARWATDKEIRQTYAHVPFRVREWRNGQALPTEQGLVLGCKGKKNEVTALVDSDDIHCLMIAASGAGKTAFFLYPNLEYACASGVSFLALDTKGDLARNYGSIAQKYYDYKHISVIDLRNPTRSDGNNLLTLINRYMDIARTQPDDLAARAKAEKYAKILAKSIVSPEGNSDHGQNAFFYDAAEGLLSSVILLLAEFLPPDKEHPEERRHIVSVFKMVQDLLEPSKVRGKSQFQVLMDKLPSEHKARWLAGAALNSSEQAMASVMSTVLSRLNSFLDSELEQILCFDSAIDAEMFAAEKSAIFLILPEEDTTKNFMAGLMIQNLSRELFAVADENGGKLKNRVILFCDELGTMPPFDILPLFSAGRSRRLTLVPIIQSMAQLEKNYGKEGASILMDNCQDVISGGFAPNSEAAETFSKALGSRTVLSGTVSRGKNDPSQSLQMMERPLLTADELKSIPKGSFIVQKTGCHPMRTHLRLFLEWGIPTKARKEIWRPSRVAYILKNERYIGDSFYQKTYRETTVPFNQHPNRGQEDRFYAKGTHPGIVEKDVFDAAQILIEKRKDVFAKATTQNIYPLTSRIQCSECGSFYRRRIVSGTVKWVCSLHKDDSTACDSNYYSEERIYDGFISMVNKLRFSEDNILGQVISRLEMTLAAMKRNNLAARDLSKSIAELNAKLLMLEQLRSKGYLAPEVYQAQANEISAELAKLKDVRQEKFNSKAAIMLEEVKKLKMLIFELEEPLDAFDEKLFLEIVKSIQINKEDEMSVELLGGLRFRERI